MDVTCRYRGACFAAWQRVMPTMDANVMLDSCKTEMQQQCSSQQEQTIEWCQQLAGTGAVPAMDGFSHLPSLVLMIITSSAMLLTAGFLA
jgi:hypothetical protein